MRIRAYGSIHTYIVLHHRIIIETNMPKDLDSIIFTICIDIHASSTDTMGTITGYLCSANRILAQTRESFWWMAQRNVDYYEHVDSDWIQFYSANQIIGILLQAHGHCQAHLQHHSRHISHALHVYEVNHRRFLISLTLKLRRQGMVTRGPWAWHSADRSRQGKKPEFEMSLPVPSIDQYMDMPDYTLS
jgi:hypothetical protein